MRITILVAALLATSATARAEGVGVVVTGDATIQPQLAAQVEDWLRQRGHELVAAPLRPEALGTLIDCFVIEDLACARKVVEQEAGSPRLLFAKAELTVTAAAARDVTITGYWFARGSEPMAARRTCAACTDAAMHATIDDVMTTLAGKARVDVGTLEVAVAPVGARVRIDGKDAGRAPAGASLPVGDHVVEVSASGYTDQRRTVTIRGGDKVVLDLHLVTHGRSNKLPLVAVGAGAALLVTGIVLYATSEADTGDKPEYRDTRTGGIVLSAIGVAAIAAGTYLYLRGGSTPDAAPAVAIVPGAAYVGWVRTF